MADKLGDRLRSLRATNPKYNSLRHFAEALGKSPSWVSKVERNQERPGSETLLQIAALLDANPDELMELAHRMDPEVEQALSERFAEVSGLLRTIKELKPAQIMELENHAKELRANQE